MLTITTKSPYAVSALVELAKCGASVPVPIGELARRRDIPVQFLESLFATLRRAGILRSQRGVRGGYLFARSPSEVTVLEVVETLEGDLGGAAAEAGEPWDEAAGALRGALGSVTIADLAEREARASGALMYHI
ncbi:MAG: Rrf2 family transcriptional regulator [Thermoleophilaceae bacterium]|nr:Rrf2 family transcriptional regulator [Thermoleophilaceae bacterium]